MTHEHAAHGPIVTVDADGNVAVDLHGWGHPLSVATPLLDRLRAAETTFPGGPAVRHAAPQRDPVFQPPDRNVRIQRQRTKGWRMPEGAVYVGRPTVFGNPFHSPTQRLSAQRPSDRNRRVEAFRDWLTNPKRSPWFGSEAASTRERLLVRLPLLRGRDLACWCPLAYADGTMVPCHADVLLELANGEADRLCKPDGEAV